MYKTIILRGARQDIIEAATWYNTKQKGLGRRFTEEVRSKVLLIRKNPGISAIGYDKIRTTVLDVFPFMIHYAVDDTNKTVIISGVFHTSLNPERWKRV